MNLNNYLMIKQAVLSQQEFLQMRGNSGPKSNLAISALMGIPGLLGHNTNVNKHNAANSAAYTQYLKSQGMGNNALSKEEFLAQGTAPKVGRDFADFMTGGFFLPTSSQKARQEKANTDAYNAYLKQNANQQNMMNAAFSNYGRQMAPMQQQPMQQQPMQQQPVQQQPTLK